MNKLSFVISCPIDTYSGYGARSRDIVKALVELNKYEVKILPQRWGNTPQGFINDHPEWKFLNDHITSSQLNKQPDIWAQVTVPNEFQAVGKYNIGITAGIETTLFPGEFIMGMNRMDLNLVSSEHSKQVALNSNFDKRDKNQKSLGHLKLEKPCEVLFEGLDLNTYYKKPTSSKTNILKDIPEEFCFLYTGGWLPGSFGEDRKNTGLMIKTFLETFNAPSVKKPALILKTHHTNYSLLDKEAIIEKINSIRTQIKGHLPNIYLLHGEMTDEEINILNNDPKIKSFISFTKGEGYGRPLAEAAITGKPIITTNWSGHVDFLKPDYNILIGGDLKKVDKSAANDWILEDSMWFNINTDVASKAMKDLVKKYKRYFEASRKQTQFLKDNFSFDKMVEKLNNFLPKIEAAPQMQQLNLPKLQKIDKTPSIPKLNLPTLKKITV